MPARNGIVALALFLFSCALYANTANHGFALDDRMLIVNNPSIHSLANVPKLFVSDYWEPRTSGLYRPLVTASYAVNHAVGGLSPRGYHWVNVMLHAGVAVLVGLISCALLGSRAVAVAAAFLFAAHAIHTEAVTAVAGGRAELLCALFVLLSLTCHIRCSENSQRAGFYYGAGLASFGLALLCKETGFTLPALVFLWDLTHRSPAGDGLFRAIRNTLRERFTRVYAGYIATAVVALIARTAALHDSGALLPMVFEDNPLVELDAPARIINALVVAWRYVYLLVFPYPLAYDYSYNQIPLRSASDPIALGAVLLTGALAWLTLRSFRGSRKVFFALGFSFVTFSLVSNVMMPIGTIMGERLAYLPSLGFCWLAAIGLRKFTQRAPFSQPQRSALFAAIVALVVLLHGGRTLARNADWQSAERLFLHDVSISSNSAKAHFNAGGALTEAGRFQQAIAHYERSIEIMGGRTTYAYNDLGYLLVDRAIDIPRGIALLEKILSAAPNDPEILDSMAWGYHMGRRHREALHLLQRSIAIAPLRPNDDLRKEHLRAIQSALAGPTRSP